MGGQGQARGRLKRAPRFIRGKAWGSLLPTAQHPTPNTRSPNPTGAEKDAIYALHVHQSRSKRRVQCKAETCCCLSEVKRGNIKLRMGGAKQSLGPCGSRLCLKANQHAMLCLHEPWQGDSRVRRLQCKPSPSLSTQSIDFAVEDFHVQFL